MGTIKQQITTTEDIAKQLAAWRERMGFSQTDAANALGCSRPAFAGWEKGRQPIPTYIRLACSALALGLPPMGAMPEETHAE